SASPQDRHIDLSWASKTPWVNKLYKVFRKDSGAASFFLAGTTTLSSFTDNSNVKNGSLYDYYVQSEGEYGDVTILKPLVNRSQIIAVRAVDKTPPVTPTLSIDADCATGAVELTWTDISNQSDDVASYQLFYKPSTD